MGNFKIGELASAAGVGRDTIRYYERMGLLRAPERTAAGYRLYNETDLERVDFIRSAQELGFTLEQARQLLELRASDSTSAQAVLDITHAKISDAEVRLKLLSDIRDMLQMLADECPGEVPISDCPILAFLAARRKDQRQKTKDEVAREEQSLSSKGVIS
ncbi:MULTISPECIES: heavy metal-responsive transcriptional regulator [Sphingobium]|uniref:MerR family transcriptional regulator n=1 Tax=Sphingobium baderi LL03 TaxID=1114964 RepID=T0GTR1_9SPHN|nr:MULTISPECIES: MerR family transcriptional regulator [Sphingobium]EQB04082.1 MerR family transcriptional regulator [Sphingobium baderi LL03]KMS63129.1 MerR family transcriptional regulator [Sphingobium baderi LL03]MDX3910619.1 heavy metal-responsive transcriptional regulator [Sphingobium sp.]